jgi:cysteinyl-tRNA synthetase
MLFNTYEPWKFAFSAESIDLYNLTLEFDKALGLNLDKPLEIAQENTDIPQEIKDLAEKRWQAKQSRDWGTADAIRNELTSLGYAVKDTKDGYDIIRL